MSKKTTAKINGLDVTDVTYSNPAGSLPKFVRDQTKDRGYGDATQPLSLFVQDTDVAEAFDCAAQGNGSSCVMAQAGTRIGAKSVYFYRTTAWVDFGYGPIVRFSTSKSIYTNVIEPFDKGDRDGVKPGIYHLMPPTASNRLESKRTWERDRVAAGERRKKKKSDLDGSRSVVVQAHTERVVMASQAE